MFQDNKENRRNCKIIILSGGWSSEREVSLNSGQNICDALKKRGWNALFYDAKGDILQLGKDLQNHAPDLVFNALHGTYGEDGAIQGLLNLMGLRFTHSDIAASAVAMDKMLTKRILSQFGIKFAESYLINKKDSRQKLPIAPPYVLKPVKEGSSRGVILVMDVKSQEKINYGRAENMYPQMIEKYISGRELTVAVLDNYGALGVTELVPKQGFYDYDAKYNEGMTDHICPADIPEKLAKKCRDDAEQAHQILGCKQVSRSDFRYCEEDDTLYFLEINTHPGMTELSLVPEQAKLHDLDFADLCDYLVIGAIQ